MTAATATTTAPVMAATPMPSTKACLAASTSAPPSAPSRWATSKAPTRPDSAAAWSAPAGRATASPIERGVGRGDERAEHGHAEGAAELAGGVVHGRADAGLAERHRRHDQRRQRRHGEGHAGGQEEDRAVDPPDRGVDADEARTAARPMATEPGPTGTTRCDAEAGDQLRHLRRQGHHHERHRQLEQAGLEGGVAEHQLEVLRHEEERAEHGEEDRASCRRRPR